MRTISYINQINYLINFDTSLTTSSAVFAFLILVLTAGLSAFFEPGHGRGAYWQGRNRVLLGYKFTEFYYQRMEERLKRGI